MTTIIQPGPRAWQHTCERCATVFRYSLGDMRNSLVFGAYVVCPGQGCGKQIYPEGQRQFERRSSEEDRRPSYADLLVELRWCANTLESAAELIEEEQGDFADEEEQAENEEVRERVAAIRQMLERAR